METTIGALRRDWWVLVVRGAFAVVFGLFAWLWPKMTLLVLILSWGTWASVTGIISLVGAYAADERGRRNMLLLEGGVSLAAGLFALLSPRASALLFLYLLALWAIVSGAVDIAGAWKARRAARGELWLGIAGAASVAFGLVLLLRPRAGALAYVWLIASFAVLYGCVLIAWGLHLRGKDEPGDRPRLGARSAQ